MLSTRRVGTARAKSMRPPHHTTRALNVRTREANERAEGGEELAEEEEERMVVVGVEEGGTAHKGRATAPLEMTSWPCQQRRVSCRSVSYHTQLIDAVVPARLLVATLYAT